MAKVLFLFPTDNPHPGRDVVNDRVQWEGPGGGGEGGRGGRGGEVGFDRDGVQDELQDGLVEKAAV